MFVGATRTEIWLSCHFFAENLKFVSLWLRNFLKNTSLFKRTFLLSKRSSALKESYFEKPSKKSLQKSEIDKTGPRTSGIVMKFNPWICNFQFSEGSQKFFEQFPRVFLLRIWRRQKIISSLQNCFFFKMFHSCLIFCRISKTFFALTPKFNRKHFFVRKNFSSLKTILSARKKQFS